MPNKKVRGKVNAGLSMCARMDYERKQAERLAVLDGLRKQAFTFDGVQYLGTQVMGREELAALKAHVLSGGIIVLH